MHKTPTQRCASYGWPREAVPLGVKGEKKIVSSICSYGHIFVKTEDIKIHALCMEKSRKIGTTVVKWISLGSRFAEGESGF